MRSRLTALLAALAIIAMGGFVAGCGGDDDDDQGTAAAAELTATPGLDDIQADQAIAAAVPADIKSQGTLIVAADATYPPDEYIAEDGKTVIGMDRRPGEGHRPDHGSEGGVQNVTFDSIIPGLAAGKYDLGMSSFTDTKEREQTVDFVTYLTAGIVHLRQCGRRFQVGLRSMRSAATRSRRREARPNRTTSKSRTRSARPRASRASRGVILPDQNGVNLALSSG